MQRHAVALLAVVFLGLVFARSAEADEVGEAIDAAKAAYEAGDSDAAEEELNFALALLKQMKADRLGAILPPAPEGWTAEEADGGAGAGAAFLGGVGAARSYRQGDRQATVSIVTESPALQGFLAMAANPNFAAAQGGRLERIGRQKAVVVYDEANQDGQVMMAVGQAYVTVEGRAPREILIELAKGVDTKALKDF